MSDPVAQQWAPGQVIEARTRLWRVDACDGRVLQATTIDGGSTERHRLYLPFEHIALGQLEPPRADQVGRAGAIELLLRAHRLSMIHGTAPFLGLQRSSVIPTNYQLIPVVMALEAPRVRLLLADDVGLGKTIEAGLVVSELLARQRARNLLVICPASLREQWQEQLNRFFHLDARVISTRHRREMERQLPAGANPWEFYPVLVTSVDYAKQPAIKHQILEVDWDIVVIDEAHTVAKPHQQQEDQVVTMDRWQLAEAVAERCQHLLLLTATPHNGYSDSYASLLRMLHDDCVTGPAHEPDVDRNIAQHLVCQRRREDVIDWFGEGSNPFPTRDQSEVYINLSDQEQTAIDAVREYGNLVLQNAQGSRQRPIAQWTVMHLHKRALSSPEALRRSLKNRRDALARKLEASDSDQDDLSIPEDVAQANAMDADPGERFSEEEAGERVERQVIGDPAALATEIEQLDKVIEAARKVTVARDSKLAMLRDKLLPELLGNYPTVIIFTKFLDTLEYVEQQLAKSDLGIAIFTLFGGMTEAQRRERFLAFETAERAVLLATDCISEGINLQHAAAQIVHYELPWNPNRLEQRNGRVDRYGQPEQKVFIRTLVMRDRLDAYVAQVLVRKSREIRQNYGFSPPFFGKETAILDLMLQQGVIGPGGQMNLFDVEANEAFEEAATKEPYDETTMLRIQSESFYGQTDIELPDVERKLTETYQAVGSSQEIEDFVLSALRWFGCRVEANQDRTWRLAITDPSLLGGTLANVVERATFDPTIAQDDPNTTTLDLGHPLVRRLVDAVKQAAFTEPERYGRTAYRVTTAVSQTTALLHVLARYAVGTDPVSVVEELIPVALAVYDDAVLPEAEARRLFAADPTAETRTNAEVAEELAELLGRSDLDAVVRQAAANRCAELAQERLSLRTRLAQRGGDPAWLAGLDRLEVASTDLLTVEILYPA